MISIRGLLFPMKRPRSRKCGRGVKYLLSFERPCRVFFTIDILAEGSGFIRMKKENDE